MPLKNNLYFLFHILTARIFRLKRPYIVILNVTNRCNSRCSYCYVKYYERTTDEMSTEAIFDIIDKLAAGGTFRINLCGGEPLIHPEIERIVDYIKGKKIEVCMTSNGFLVPEKIDACKKLDLLTISLDGRQENHDLNRGTGSFKKVLQAIEVCHRNKISLQISTVITCHNIDDLDYLIELAKSFDFKLTFAAMINQTQENEVKKQTASSPTNEEYREFFKKILFLKNKGGPIIFSKKAYQQASYWPDFAEDKIMYRTPEFKHIHCYAGSLSGLIDANGDLYPCPQLVDVIRAKNIVHDGFEEAWKYIATHPCKTCFSPCSSNLNLILGLDFSTLWDLLKNYQGRRFGL